MFNLPPPAGGGEKREVTGPEDSSRVRIPNCSCKETLFSLDVLGERAGKTSLVGWRRKTPYPDPRPILNLIRQKAERFPSRYLSISFYTAQEWVLI
jgi:hypothetical protein